MLKLKNKGIVVLLFMLISPIVNAQTEYYKLEELPTEKEFHEGLPVTGKVETTFGTYELDHGYPTKESSTAIYDLMDEQRATQLYLWGLPIVGIEGIFQHFFQLYDNYDYNKLMNIDTFNDRRGFLTANESTNYSVGYINTRDAAVVIKIPAGKIVGMVDDFWQQSPADLGLFGVNHGKGGTHVFVGPNTPQDMIPEPSNMNDDFQVHHLNTDRAFIVMRILGDKASADKLWSKVKINNYPDDKVAEVIPVNNKFLPTYQPRGLKYWTMLHAAIQNEDVAERDRFFMAWLKELGIEKGKPFNPDERQKKILINGTKAGELMAKNFVFRERLDGVIVQNDWRYVLGGAWGDGIKNTQRMKYYDTFDPRARYTYEAVTTSPAMTIPRPGTAQGYLGKFMDEEGEILKGGENYVLKLSGKVPANLFWSLTAYDANTRVLVDNRAVSPVGGKVSVESVNPDLKINDDGTIYVFFGPDKPVKGWEANYIQTLPDNGWFVYIRAYGAEESLFDGSYKLPTLEKVKSIEKFLEENKK